MSPTQQIQQIQEDDIYELAFSDARENGIDSLYAITSQRMYIQCKFDLREISDPNKMLEVANAALDFNKKIKNLNNEFHKHYYSAIKLLAVTKKSSRGSQQQQQQQQQQQLALDTYEFMVSIAPIGIPALSAILAAWLTARFQKRLILKFKDLSVEATNISELEAIMRLLEKRASLAADESDSIMEIYSRIPEDQKFSYITARQKLLDQAHGHSGDKSSSNS